ncbi:EGF-like and EMI domain-containing protein 1 isoform X1 [Lutra lutra]|uniref:EGF-like and EMI domain-containing protein 1 isoform X1 n=1 Tax=Lutra lutra TaxID=9657 RepID=UPI001FD601F1|nr:EGF-like and EMI domain-containing protein 1 isoform X1 [Lutra lutra]
MNYKLSLFNCFQMDPCTGGNGCAHICQSENGVTRCVCCPGYQLSNDKKAYGDMNKPAEGLAPCSHSCGNTMGSFICAFHPGFELETHGKQSSNPDECECGEACCIQLCINYLGHYKCRSQERFISSDGGRCDGKFLRSNMKSLCDGPIHARRLSEAKG